MPSKGVGHPDFCNKVEENDNDNGGSAPSLDSEGEDDVGDGVEGEKVEDSVAKEVGGQHCARHHACGMAQPGNNLFERFEKPSEHRSHTYLNSLCDNSEEEAPYNNLAHVLETVCDRWLNAMLHDLTD